MAATDSPLVLPGDAGEGQGPTTTRRALARHYWLSRGPWLSLLAIGWTVTALALIALFSLFVYEKARTGGNQWFGVGLLVFALLWVLFVVEGAELATAALLDKDLEQVNDVSARATLARVQESYASFFNGRQTIVISSIVALTLTVQQVAHLPVSVSAQHSGLLAWLLRSQLPRLMLSFGFPNFIVLWISQLYPKLLAAGEPLRRFSLPSHLMLISLAMSLERHSNIGAPTTALGIARHRLLLGDDSPAELAPSRREMYRSLATFNYRTGVVHLSTLVIIGGDGHITVTEVKTMRIYAGGTTVLRTQHAQRAPIDRSSVFLRVSREDRYGAPGPAGFRRIAAGPDGASGGGICAAVIFAEPLVDGDIVRQDLRYETAPGALTMQDQEVERYRVLISRPTEQLEMIIRPLNPDRFSFSEGDCAVVWTDQSNHEGRFFEEERRRCRLRSCEGGYHLRIDNPTVGTQLVMSWRVNDKRYDGAVIVATQEGLRKQCLSSTPHACQYWQACGVVQGDKLIAIPQGGTEVAMATTASRSLGP